MIENISNFEKTKAMSVIHIKQIQQKIRDLFASQIDMTDINPKDQEKEP